MPIRPPLHRPRGQRSKQERDRDHDLRRGSARARGYTTRWDKARATFLARPENCLCVKCRADGILNPGNLRMNGQPETNPKRHHLVVDHIKPHRGDQALFWDTTNWQPLCPDHHDIVKQREEARGYVIGTDASGRPRDPDHPWNRQGRTSGE